MVTPEGEFPGGRAPARVRAGSRPPSSCSADDRSAAWSAPPSTTSSTTAGRSFCGSVSSSRPIPAPGPRSVTRPPAFGPAWRTYTGSTGQRRLLANVCRDFATLPEAHQQVLRGSGQSPPRGTGGAVPGRWRPAPPAARLAREEKMSTITAIAIALAAAMTVTVIERRAEVSVSPFAITAAAVVPPVRGARPLIRVVYRAANRLSAPRGATLGYTGAGPAPRCLPAADQYCGRRPR